MLQFQNKHLANMNKELRAKLTDLQGELTLKQNQMDSIESGLGHFASSLVKVSFFTP